MTKTNRKAVTRRSAWRDSRGAVMVEYALLLTFVAVPTVVGLTASGVQLLSGYVRLRNTLLSFTP